MSKMRLYIKAALYAMSITQDTLSSRLSSDEMRQKMNEVGGKQGQRKKGLKIFRIASLTNQMTTTSGFVTVPAEVIFEVLRNP